MLEICTTAKVVTIPCKHHSFMDPDFARVWRTTGDAPRFSSTTVKLDAGLAEELDGINGKRNRSGPLG
jgi:hypothetical protein